MKRRSPESWADTHSLELICASGRDSGGCIGGTVEEYEYRAERFNGVAARGTIVAASLDDAQRQLAEMSLRVYELASIAVPKSPTRLGVADLQTFNEFLMQISSAGVPVERGLALLSNELRSPSLRAAIDRLVRDLEAGEPIERAIGTNRDSFPPLYGQLIDAGIQTANLTAVLQQFGRHMDDMSELRDSLWRACAYPALVFFALLVLLSFLGYWLLPGYFASLQSMKFKVIDLRTFQSVSVPTQIPWAAVLILYLGRLAPVLIGLYVLLGLAISLAVRAVRTGRGGRRWIDRVILPMPIVGSAVRDSYVASWLDVMSIGVSAGLDLPRAIRLADSAVALPSLTADGEAICGQIEHGREAAEAPISILPLTVPLAVDIAQANTHLPRSFASLAQQYREQARRQIRQIPGRVMPALLVTIGLLAGGIMYSLWLPMAELLRSLGLNGRF